MKRTSLAVLIIALAILAMAAPMAYAQAPAPKVTISGLIDNLTTYSSNASQPDGVLNVKDKMWYARTRGRFDFIGEVGKAKGVLGIELDHVYGQAGSNDSTIVNAGAASGTAVATQFGTDGSFDLNTDSRGIIEIKWLYVEFPMPLIPVPTTVRLGAQPFGAASSYKLCVYTCSDFPGVNITSQITPNVKLLGTYVQVEERLVGTQNVNNGVSGPFGIANTQERGDDYSWILSAEITPFKGLDLKPMISQFYAQGTTSPNSRQGRGGIDTSTAFVSCGGPAANGTVAAASCGNTRGDINEYRWTVGLDTRFRSGPFSFDPTVMYQFGSRNLMAQTTNAAVAAGFANAGVVGGRRYHSDISAWLVDMRGGFQLGPLLLEALGVYSTGNSARNTTLGTVRYFQALTTDTGYLSDWGTQLSSLGIDYLNALNEVGARVAYPGVSVGWDKYGRGQLGLKATYAVTPALSVMAGANGHWTPEAVDKHSQAIAGAGLLPTFVGPQAKSNFVGTELMSVITWRFADGLVWDNGFGYMFAGPALNAITANQDQAQHPRTANDSYILTSRIRFTF